jgi:7-cyano-7-deazaguanine reductase
MADDFPVLVNLELVENLFSDRNYDIKISIPEFTCVCPRTGQPDFATIKIYYIPNKLIVELKSLKLYLQQYRGIGIFHEAVTNKIMDDVRGACSPRKIEVIGQFNARGGISTNVIARWPE